MAMVNAGDKQKYELQLVVETFLILEKILEANGGLGLTEICKSMQITKNKAFRMLSTMIQCGILEKDERSNYNLGVTSIVKAQRIIAKESSRDKVLIIMDSIAKLINEAVYFAKYNGTETVLVELIDCCQPIKAASFVGAAIHLPITTTVTGENAVANIGEITVDTESVSAEITAISMPYVNEQGVEIGALVVLAPTYRMPQSRIITEIIPAFRDVMQRKQLQLRNNLQNKLLPMSPPVGREYTKYQHPVSKMSTKIPERLGWLAV